MSPPAAKDSHSVQGPFSGVTGLYLTRGLAGPYCTLILADLGARVIKVEMPGRGDDARQIGPFIADQSAYFMSINRSKESIALNLKEEADRAVFEALLERADVLVENFRPETMERLGYGWERLHARHPALIYAAASGFGHTGPYAKRPAYDLVVQAMGGIMSITGQPGAPPTRVGTSIGDIAAGLFTAVGVNAALVHRQRTGEGMKIDVAMLDCQVAILENALARYLATREVPAPIGARHPSITPFDAFKTGDGFVVIAAGNDPLFAKLCDLIDRHDLLEDARFGDNESRTRHEALLKTEIERSLSGATAATWLERLAAEGIPCAPIQDVAQLLSDPQVAARRMVVRLEDPIAGDFRTAGNPIKLSGFPDPETRKPAPALDADGPRIRRELGRKPNRG
jgi:CoA:oxalate CoA-transferase